MSGVIDSPTLCAYYLNKGLEVTPLTFRYGSKHNKYENESVYKVAEFLNLPTPKLIDLYFVGELFKSDLLLSEGDIPDGHHDDESMQVTVVPGRNFIFASIIAGFAEIV
jgi:7-cyano-7-deazaguanine synthase